MEIVKNYHIAQNQSREDEVNYASVEALDYWPHQVILITLYTFISVVSFTLNSLTITILVKCDKIYSELYLYLINLALSDIVMSLLCIPFTYSSFILNRWIFPHFICPFVNFAQICSVMVSIWTLTVIGIERYYIITNSRVGVNSNRHRKRLFSIAIIWLVAVCSGYVQFVFARVVPVEYRNQTLFNCRENFPDEYAKLYTIYLFVSTFGLPLLILVYVYSTIGYRVWRHVGSSMHDHPQDHNRKKVVKMMLLVVCLFVLCWFPLQIFTLLAAFVDNFLLIGSERDYRLLVYGYLVAHILAMTHSFVNPIVYCFFSRKFWAILMCVVLSGMLRHQMSSDVKHVYHRMNEAIYQSSIFSLETYLHSSFISSRTLSGTTSYRASELKDKKIKNMPQQNKNLKIENPTCEEKKSIINQKYNPKEEMTRTFIRPVPNRVTPSAFQLHKQNLLNMQMKL